MEKLIGESKHLKTIFLTRKSFADIPNIKIQVDKIQKKCDETNIKFKFLPTPARFENEKKLNDWKKTFKQ